MTRISCPPFHLPRDVSFGNRIARIGKQKLADTYLNQTFTEPNENMQENNAMFIRETKTTSKAAKLKFHCNIPPPIVVQSPRIGCDCYNTDSDDDLMLPSELVAKIVSSKQKHNFNFHLLGEKSKTPQQNISYWNQSDSDFAPISFDCASNSLPKIPYECDTPSRLMLEIKIQEAQENIEYLNKKWKANIEESKANSKTKIEKLLASHSIEMLNLDREFGESQSPRKVPSILSCVIDEGQKVKARHTKCNMNEIESEKSLSYIEKKKELVAKQTKEIIDQNYESNQELQNLQERKAKELERPKARLEALINEFNSIPGTRKISTRQESFIVLDQQKVEKKKVRRLSLKSKP